MTASSPDESGCIAGVSKTAYAAATALGLEWSHGQQRIRTWGRMGGAYDPYVAGLAAYGKFSGVVMLSHRGRTVPSRRYGMADKEKGILNNERVALTRGRL